MLLGIVVRSRSVYSLVHFICSGCFCSNLTLGIPVVDGHGSIMLLFPFSIALVHCDYFYRLSVRLSVFLFRFLYSLRQILRLISSGESYLYKKWQYWLVVIRQDIAPFSWMKYIVISKADLEGNGKAIWLHEKAHIDAGHSVDMLLMSLFFINPLFNPAVVAKGRFTKCTWIWGRRADKSRCQHKTVSVIINKSCRFTALHFYGQQL